MRLRRRLSSVRLTSPLRLETVVMRLLAKLSTLSSDRWLMFSILLILLL